MKFQSALLTAALVAASFNSNNVQAFSPSSISIQSRQQTTTSMGMVATTEIVDGVVNGSIKPRKTREVGFL